MDTKFIIAAHSLITYRRSFITTRRFIKNDYISSLWDLPGGIVHPGETPKEALKR